MPAPPWYVSAIRPLKKLQDIVVRWHKRWQLKRWQDKEAPPPETETKSVEPVAPPPPRRRCRFPSIPIPNVATVILSRSDVAYFVPSKETRRLFLLFVALNAINTAFSYGWVIGNTRQLARPFLRVNLVGKFFYAFFMMIFNLATVYFEVIVLLTTVGDCLRSRVAIITFRIALLLWTMAHLGAPFIANDIVSQLDWAGACGNAPINLIYRARNAQFTTNTNNVPIASQSIVEPDADHTRLQFIRNMDVAGKPSPYGYNGGIAPVTALNITVNRNGQGVITGDCEAGGGTDAGLQCVSGSVAFLQGHASVSVTLTRNQTGTVKTFATTPESAWFYNPVQVASAGARVIYTAVRTYSNDVKLCGSDPDVAIVLSAFVPQFQARAQDCDHCFVHCTTCCYETCSTTSHTTCDSKGVCSSSSTTTCTCHGCPVKYCRGECFNRCKGIGLPAG
jgi:hypothetical protein